MLSPTCRALAQLTFTVTLALTTVTLRAANETGAATSAAAVPAEQTSAAKAAAPWPSYDRDADFAVEQRGTDVRGNAEVRDFTFVTVPGAKFGRTAAYLVQPRGRQANAAILWVHWLGRPATTNRTEFLEEAVALANRGVVSLLVDTMWAKPRWYADRVLDHDFDDGVAQANALRRAIDLLQQQPGAAKLPLGIVGHDYGGMYSIIATAQDKRAKTCVFVACTSSLLDWAFFRQKPQSMEAYQMQNAPLDLKTHIAALAGTPIFFQFAEHDEYIPLAKAQDLFSAAKTPKQMSVYGGASHEMTEVPSIREDRDAWLVRELGLAP